MQGSSAPRPTHGGGQRSTIGLRDTNPQSKHDACHTVVSMPCHVRSIYRCRSMYQSL